MWPHYGKYDSKGSGRGKMDRTARDDLQAGHRSVFSRIGKREQLKKSVINEPGHKKRRRVQDAVTELTPGNY